MSVEQSDNKSFYYNPDEECNRLVKQCEQSLENIDQFISSISEQLSEYEMSNIFLLKSLGEQYREIDTNLSECINTVEMYERELLTYEKSVVNIRSNFDELQLFSDWEHKHKNKVTLYEELTSLINKLDVDPTMVDTFFNSNKSIVPDEMCSYVQKLVDSCRSSLPNGIAKLACVKQQIRSLETLSYQFSERFLKFIQTLIRKEIADHSAAIKYPSLHSHSSIFITIGAYSPIMQQIKILNSVGFSEIYTYYCHSFNEHFSKEWQIYIENIIKSVPFFDTTPVENGLQSPLYRDPPELLKRSATFSKIFTEYLGQAEAATKECGEHGDCFFGFTLIDSDESTKKSQSKVALSSGEIRFKGGELKIRGMLQAMFSFLESTTFFFLDECTKKDPYYLISASNIITTISSSASMSASTSDYFSYFLKNLITKSKSLFSNLFSIVENLLEDEKSFRKQKSNSFNSVAIFQEFLSLCEILSKDVKDKNPHLIAGYQALIKKVITVAEHSGSSQESKISREIYMLENLYNLHACLSNIQIKELVDDRKALRTQYQNAVNYFVASILSKPFGKLTVFVEEIDKKLEKNTSHNDVEVWVYNNKHDLKKSVKECTLKEVKKNIKNIHERVTKYFNDISLLSVVWKSIQEEILSQLKKFDKYLKDYCGRLPEIHLDFAIEDIFRFLVSMNTY